MERIRPLVDDERIGKAARQYIGSDTPASVAVYRELMAMRDEYEYIFQLMRQEIEKLQIIIEETP